MIKDTINGHTKEYWQGLQEGMKHVEPSPETMRRLLNLEEACRPLPLFMQKVESKLNDHTEVHEDILTVIKEMQMELRESNGWKNKFLGALAVITFVVFPIMLWVVREVVSIDEKIQTAINNSFTIEVYEAETNK